MPLYTDGPGRRYRAAGRVPLRELPAGTPYALAGDVRVYFRGTAPLRAPAEASCPNGIDRRILRAAYNADVTLLEEVGGAED